MISDGCKYHHVIPNTKFEEPMRVGGGQKFQGTHGVLMQLRPLLQKGGILQEGGINFHVFLHKITYIFII